MIGGFCYIHQKDTELKYINMVRSGLEFEFECGCFFKIEGERLG